jgi:histidine triad (HIT) family protein
VTIFSKIMSRDIPAKIVHEDNLCLAFHDIQPRAPIHVLLIPKKAVRSLAELETEDSALMGHLIITASKIAKQLGISDSGYRLVANTNADAGQSVSHLHFHILGGRQMTWPPG